MKKKIKINKNLIIVICVGIIILAAFFIQSSLSKYVIEETQEHAQESSKFYFESNLADIDGQTFYIIDEYKEISFYVRNYNNNLLYTMQEIEYEINVESDDGISVVIKDEDDNEINGTQTLNAGDILQNNYILKISKDESYTESSFNIKITIKSTSPYTKEITSNIQVSESEEEEENVISLDVSDDKEYAKLSITANSTEDITVTYDTDKLKLDESSLGKFSKDEDGKITLSSSNIEVGTTYDIIFIILNSEDDISEDDFTIE